MTHNDLYRSLGSIEGKLDMLLERDRARDEAHDKITERVSKLEHDGTAQKAMVAVIAAVVAFVSPALAKWLNLA